VSLLTIIIGTIVLAFLLFKINPGLLRTTDGLAGEEEMVDGSGGGPVGKSGQVGGSVDGSGSVGQSRSQSVFSWVILARQLAAFVLLWLAPMVFLYFSSPGFVFWKQLVLFFTQTAFFTIGGSYTVLPYVAQFAVRKLGWLSKMQMVDGFALAETTPGPLIIVVGFVGFMAGYHYFHSSVLLASLALVVTVYYTFLPCFFYIFVGGPLIEKSHGSQAIGRILQLVTAAIVGVILNLVIFLGKDVLFPVGKDVLIAGGLSLSRLDVVALVWIIVSLLCWQNSG
jgi:chromate transporter